MVRNSDPIKQSALIRKVQLNEKDPLDDKFGDASDISDAGHNIRMPQPVLGFLCILLNADHKQFYNNEDKSSFSVIKCIKIMALYQILFYDVHNWGKKIPLHIMYECRDNS